MHTRSPAPAQACLLACLCAATAVAQTELSVKFDAGEGQGFRDQVSGQRVPANAVESMPGVDQLGARFVFDYRGGIASRVEIPVTPKLAQAGPKGISMELWLAPDKVAHSTIMQTGDLEIVRFRVDHKVWFTFEAADGEQRLISGRPGSIATISFPVPTWYHVVCTYDGQVGRVFVDGKEVGSKRFPESKPHEGFSKPLVMGGHNWLRYTGGLDELAIHDRALTAEEVAALHVAAKERSTPAPAPAKETAGTLDGKPYKKDWCRMPLKSGRAELSNTGQITLVSRHRRWGHEGVLGTLSLSNSNGMKERYWTNVSGRVVIEYGGDSRLELQGTSYRGLGVKQEVTVTPKDEVKFRYTLRRAGPRAPRPSITWPFHIWFSAMPFVGYDEAGEKICGRFIDLDSPITFTRELDWNQVKAGNRLYVKLAPGWCYRVPASREPTKWLDGYTASYAQLEPVTWDGWDGYSDAKPYVVDLLLQLIPDENPPALSKQGAREVTPERPFDFSGLYEIDATEFQLVPVGRKTPIFGPQEDVEFRVHLPNEMLPELPRCEYVVRDCYTQEVVAQGQLPVEKRWWEFNGQVAFKPPKPSVYGISMKAISREGKAIGELQQEAVVVGPVAQPVAPFGHELRLKLVDEVDCTKEDATHDFYSRSGKSRVVETKAGKARQTLDSGEMSRLGTTHLDWFGYRFGLSDPSKVHVVEVIYPGIDGQTIGINVFEPGTRTFNGKPDSRCRVASGVSTGAVYPVTNAMQRFRTVYFPGARWCTVTIANIHCGDYKSGPPAAAAHIRLYELTEPLPRLPNTGAGRERLIGIHTESGELSMGAYGYGELRGERWGTFAIPDGHFYREHYRATENLIRHLRYRGDTVYIYGAYRYRNARFPSRTFPPYHNIRKGDLLALMARMFEYNDLRIVPAVQANCPVPVARLLRCGLHEIVQGEDSVAQVRKDGVTTCGSFGFLYTNPFHPRTHVAWARLADDLAGCYADCPAVAGIAWLTGPFWSPGLIQRGTALPKERADSYYFDYTYDDETMRQFVAEAELQLPGKVGDPKRFTQRYEWIMSHAKDQWIAFRCRALAAFYKKMADATSRRAPQQKFYVLGQCPMFLNNEVSASPLETWRKCGFDPREYGGQRNLVYVHCMPDGSGLNLYEHGPMPKKWMSQVRPFLDDPELYRAVESAGATGRYLHRQFFENHIEFDPKRPWVFGRGQWASSPTMLACNFYPQPGGRSFLEDFALMLAHGTPELICWMWCDGTVPFGNEEPMREFCAFLRTLPIGPYETVSQQNGVFVRRLTAGTVYYVVNTNRTPADAKVALSGTEATDLVTGRSVVLEGGRLNIRLAPAGFRSFRLR